MQVSSDIRVTGLLRLSDREGFWLREFTHPFTVVYDIHGLTNLFLRVYSRGLYQKEALEHLVQAKASLLQRLNSTYSVRTEDARIPADGFHYAYLCLYYDKHLPVFIQNALAQSIRARAGLLLTPSRQWYCSFAVMAETDIEDVLSVHFKGVREVKPAVAEAVFRGKPVEARPLQAFNLHVVPGIEQLPEHRLTIGAPSRPADHDNISIGQVIHPSTGKALFEATIPTARLNQHLCVFGTTGSGKTNAVRRLIVELTSRDIPVTVLDDKNEYSDLEGLVGARVFDFEGRNPLTVNFLKPLVEPTRHAKQVADILAEIASGGGAYASNAFTLYLGAINQLYAERGVLEGNTDWPNILDLLVKLDEAAFDTTLSERGKNGLFTARKVLHSWSVGTTRLSFGVREGIGMAELLGRPTVIQLGGLGDPQSKALFVSLFLQRMRDYRESKPVQGLRHVTVVEEAQRVLALDREASSTITATYREIRGFGEGIISVSQMPSRFSKDALANSNTFLFFRLIDRGDKLVACDILGIPPGDMALIENLPVGTGLLKVDEVHYIRVPHVQVRIMVRPVTAATPKVQREEVATAFPRRTDVANRTQALGEREWQVLKLLGESAAYNQTTLARETGLSNRVINFALGRLIKGGFVSYREAKRTGSAGRSLKVHVLRPYGEEAYRQRWNEYPDKVRARLTTNRTGHKEMTEALLRILPMAEVRHPFDLVITGPPAFAIELETGSNNNDQIQTNLQKSLDKFGTAHFVVSEQRVANAVLQEATRYSFDKRNGAGAHFQLSIALYEEFLKEQRWIVYEF